MICEWMLESFARDCRQCVSEGSCWTPLFTFQSIDAIWRSRRLIPILDHWMHNMVWDSVVVIRPGCKLMRSTFWLVPFDRSIRCQPGGRDKLIANIWRIVWERFKICRRHDSVDASEILRPPFIPKHSLVSFSIARISYESTLCRRWVASVHSEKKRCLIEPFRVPISWTHI